MLLGDKRGGRVVIPPLIGFECAECGFQLVSIVYTCKYLTTHILNYNLHKIQLLPHLPRSTYCVSREVSTCHHYEYHTIKLHTVVLTRQKQCQITEVCVQKSSQKTIPVQRTDENIVV